MPDDSAKPTSPIQLDLFLDAAPKAAPEPARSPPPERPAPKLRLIQGGGMRSAEPLTSRDAVVRVLVEAGADLLLRRISSVRAEEIERQVDEILALFDRVDSDPEALPDLHARLDALESLMSETRERRNSAKRQRSRV